MNNRLFERKPEPGVDPELSDASPISSEPRDFVKATGERIDQLEGEVDHLRACIRQLLDMVEGQPDPTDELSLLAERTGFAERRMLRVEDDVADVLRTLRRRAEDR